jgi:SAM-dependent methyltransferase
MVYTHADQYPETDHKDSVMYLTLRREINEDFAEHRVDFNVEGLEKGELLLGRCFTPDDIVVDIGSSSGVMLAEAALETANQASLVCVEPDTDAFYTYQRLDEAYQSRVTFIRGRGEELPLADNTAVGATIHNVIFRLSDPVAVLNHMKRVVKPGGFIAISSNDVGHAEKRHGHVRKVALEVMAQTGDSFTIPGPPAEGHYMRDLPKLVHRVGGLAIVNDLYVRQDTWAVVPEGRPVDSYVQSIKYSAANTDIAPEHRETWRRAVDLIVVPEIEAEIAAMRRTLKGPKDIPYFRDSIKRGMIVLRNDKAE